MRDMTTVGGPLGIEFPTPLIRNFYNRSGSIMLEGEAGMLDLALAQSVDYEAGQADSALATMIDPTASIAAAGLHLLGVAMQDIADDDYGPFLLRGVGTFTIVDSNVGDNDCLKGDGIFMKPAQAKLDCNQATTGARFVGHALVLATTSVATSKIKLWFNGIDFLGII